MFVYLNKFVLFKDNKYLSVCLSDCTDSMIVPADAQYMLCGFFNPIYALSGWWKNLGLNSHWDIELDTLLYDDKVLAEGVLSAYITDVMVVNGYVLAYFELGVRNSGLLVVTLDELRFVGFISSHYRTISTPELSRLIMSTPELDWSV